MKYSPSLLVPTAALLSTFGAVYGSTWILAILGVIPSQVCASMRVHSDLAMPQSLSPCSGIRPRQTGPALRPWKSLRDQVPCLQVLAMYPSAQYVAGFYGHHHSGFCNMLINTAFSLAAALFVFVILPAGDLILGEEPPEAVSTARHQHLGLTSGMAFECPGMRQHACCLTECSNGH